LDFRRRRPYQRYCALPNLDDVPAEFFVPMAETQTSGSGAAACRGEIGNCRLPIVASRQRHWRGLVGVNIKTTDRSTRRGKL
jgi:hypothetical protein